MDTVIIILASYLYLIIIALALIFFVYEQNKVKLVIMTGISFPFAFVLSKILTTIVQSPRPFIADHIQSLIHSATDNGFPSDHVLISASISLMILNFNKRVGIILCSLTFLVGIGRVLAHVHHSIDIIGSWLISIFAIVISKFIYHQINTQYFKS